MTAVNFTSEIGQAEMDALDAISQCIDFDKYNDAHDDNWRVQQFVSQSVSFSEGISREDVEAKLATGLCLMAEGYRIGYKPMSDNTMPANAIAWRTIDIPFSRWPKRLQYVVKIS